MIILFLLVSTTELDLRFAIVFFVQSYCQEELEPSATLIIGGYQYPSKRTREL